MVKLKESFDNLTKYGIKLKDVFCSGLVWLQFHFSIFLKKKTHTHSFLGFDSTSRINQVLISSKGEFKCYGFGIRKHYYLFLGYSIDAMDSSSKFPFTVTFIIMI